MKTRPGSCALLAAAGLLLYAGCASSRTAPLKVNTTIAQNISDGISGLQFPIPAVYRVTVEPTKGAPPGPARMELYLFPDHTYRHVGYGGTLRLDQVTDEGRWSYANTQVSLVSDGYDAVRSGTHSTLQALWTSFAERGVWPTVSDDWIGVQLAPAGYAYDRPIAEDEAAQLKDSIDRKYGRFSPASLVWRFPMTGPARGERRPDGTIVLSGFASITIAGVAVQAESVEVRPDFRSVHIVKPAALSDKLKSGPDLAVFVDDNQAAL